MVEPATIEGIFRNLDTYLLDFGQIIGKARLRLAL